MNGTHPKAVNDRQGAVVNSYQHVLKFTECEGSRGVGKVFIAQDQPALALQRRTDIIA
jgi:hypothetical protein